MFEVDLGRIKFKWRGAYDNTTQYEVDDVVGYGGSSFVCVLDSLGNTPTTAANPHWETMALGSDLGSTVTAAGDIIYYNGSDFAKLAAGTQGNVLTQGGLNRPQWSASDITAPIIQTRQFSDFVRTQVNNGNYYYFGITDSPRITPRKYNSLIRVSLNLFSEPDGHNCSYRVQYSTDNWATGTNMLLTNFGQNYHGMFQGYEYSGDYASTPSHSNFQLTQAFSTLNEIKFRLYVGNGNNVMMNSSWTNGYESAPSTITLEELNADYNSVEYNGGT
jgi:hypothetical protein